ncbi:hypothetical protein MJD09_15455 [bacterium]|nr:hypothetical protein [bacterium]
MEEYLMKVGQLFEATPARIKTAVYLVYASVILRILGAFFTTIGQKWIDEPVFLTIPVVGSLLVCFVGFKIGRGENWARIVYLILVIWSLISFPIFISDFSAPLIFTMIMILTLAMQVYTVIIIFTGESKKWFKKHKINQHQVSPAN